jgi:hypothetical protein
VDRSPRGGRSRLREHVYSGNVPVLQPERLNCPRDPVEIFAAHRDIDIPREAPGVRLRFFHVKIHCQTANHAVFERGGSERSFYPFCEVKSCSTRFSKNVLT